MRKFIESRRFFILLDAIIAIMGVTCGCCYWIAYGDWQAFAWSLVLAGACLRSGIGQAEVARYRQALDVAHMQIEALCAKIRELDGACGNGR